MDVKVYLPTDSLHVYIDNGEPYPKLFPQGHVRIMPQDGDKITLSDGLIGSNPIVDKIPFGNFYAEDGTTALGVDMDATLLALAKIL